MLPTSRETAPTESSTQEAVESAVEPTASPVAQTVTIPSAVHEAVRAASEPKTPSEVPPTGAVWAVLVVHGVGDTGPGITVDALLPSLATVNPNLRPNGIQEVRWLSEPGANDRFEPFPVHVRRATVETPTGDDPSTATVAELYWADLSRVRATFVDLLLALVSLVFLIRFVTDQAAAIRQNSSLARWTTQMTRFLLYCAGWLLIGPIAAQTALLTLFLAVGFTLEAALPEAPWMLPLLCVANTLLGLFFVGVAWTQNWDSTWKVFVFWFSVATGYMSANAWFMGLTLDRTAAHLFVTLAAFYGGLGVLSALAFIVGFVALCCPSSHSRPGLWAALATLSIQVGLWVLTVPLLGLVVLGRLPEKAAGHVRDFLAPAWTALSVHLVFLGSIILTALLVQGYRWSWAKRNSADLRFRETHPGNPGLVVPRLIVSWLLLLILLSSFALGYAGYWTTIAGVELGIKDKTLHSVSSVVVAVAAIAVPILFVSFSDGLRAGLHVLLDVTNHFYRRKERVPWFWRGPMPTGQIVGEFTTQQRIEARFRLVLAELLRDTKVTHLTIVAHSQGTMIAVNALNSCDVNTLLWKRGRPVEIFLVTMGSPLTHIYQFYFPFRYPPLPHPLTPTAASPDDTWEHLPLTVQHWLNVYRIDDFIGTYVECIDDKHQWLTNRAVARGGHTGYWRQPEVLQHLKEWLPGR